MTIHVTKPARDGCFWFSFSLLDSAAFALPGRLDAAGLCLVWHHYSGSFGCDFGVHAGSSRWLLGRGTFSLVRSRKRQDSPPRYSTRRRNLSLAWALTSSRDYLRLENRLLLSSGESQFRICSNILCSQRRSWQSRSCPGVYSWGATFPVSDGPTCASETRARRGQLQLSLCGERSGGDVRDFFDRRCVD